MKESARRVSAEKSFVSGISAQLRASVERELPKEEDVERLTFRQYVDKVRPGYVWRKHNRILGRRLQQVADGDLKRLMVFMPPRHGKSEQVSRLFPAYCLYRHPHKWVGLASYNSDLANDLSIDARDFFLQGGGRLAAGRAKVRQWQTFERGGMWSAGIGGSITGRGFDFGIIDDPVKDQSEADSARIRRRNERWYESTFDTRQQDDDAAIIIVLTRWPPKDLCSFILETEDDPQAAEGWHIICFPGLAEPEEKRVVLPPEWKPGDEVPREFPETCTVEEDWRSEGQALAPDIRSRTSLERQKARINAYWFDSVIQQRPHSQEGALFKDAWWHYVESAPMCQEYCRYWDLAATGGGGDYTVGVLLGRIGRKYYVIDVVRDRLDPGERDTLIDETDARDWEAYGPKIQFGVEQEPGSSGKDVAQQFVRRHAGKRAFREPATGSVELRAGPFASASQNGDVYVLKGAPWTRAWSGELTSFPESSHDDQVVATAGAFRKIALDVVMTSIVARSKGGRARTGRRRRNRK